MSNLADDLLIHHFIVICDFLFLMEREGERGGEEEESIGRKVCILWLLVFQIEDSKENVKEKERNDENNSNTSQEDQPMETESEVQYMYMYIIE